MKFDNLSEIAAQGFVTVEALQKSNCREVPYMPGVYLVIWPRIQMPKFLKESCGGHFKGKNPTVAVSMLADQWVEGANVIYIGKAGFSTGEATLHKRLRALMKFGLGVPIGHWGGRYIWQIADSEHTAVMLEDNHKR